MSRREIINTIKTWGVKTETRKSKRRENIAPKTSVLKACSLSLSASEMLGFVWVPLCVVPSSDKIDPIYSCLCLTPDPQAVFQQATQFTNKPDTARAFENLPTVQQIAVLLLGRPNKPLIAIVMQLL